MTPAFKIKRAFKDVTEAEKTLGIWRIAMIVRVSQSRTRTVPQR
jgi:hypothetical protein